MSFDEYVTYLGTPENLAREAGWWLGPRRRDFSGLLDTWFARVRLSGAQIDAIRWLAAQPQGPAKLLVISEEWSSDCRRDVPVLARLAEAGGLELRIFPRDGQKVGRGPRANPDDSPNADIVNAFLNEKNGQTFQSVPVAVFFMNDLRYLFMLPSLPYARDLQREPADYAVSALLSQRLVDSSLLFRALRFSIRAMPAGPAQEEPS